MLSAEASNIQFVWPASAGRYGRVMLPHHAGRRLGLYFKHAALRRYGVGALIKTCKMTNLAGDRIHTTYVPIAGDCITFWRKGRL